MQGQHKNRIGRVRENTGIFLGFTYAAYNHVHAYYCQYWSTLLSCYGDIKWYPNLAINSNHSMFRDISPSGHSIHVDSEYFREISSDHS